MILLGCHRLLELEHYAFVDGELHGHEADIRKEEWQSSLVQAQNTVILHLFREGVRQVLILEVEVLTLESAFDQIVWKVD